MSLTIWKFSLTPPSDRRDIPMPKAARLLSVDVQAGALCLWALVDPTAPTVTRRLRICGTGHPIRPDDATTFVGTGILLGGALVFHVFDLGEVL